MELNRFKCSSVFRDSERRITSFLPVFQALVAQMLTFFILAVRSATQPALKTLILNPPGYDIKLSDVAIQHFLESMKLSGIPMTKTRAAKLLLEIYKDHRKKCDRDRDYRYGLTAVAFYPLGFTRNKEDQFKPYLQLTRNEDAKARSSKRQKAQKMEDISDFLSRLQSATIGLEQYNPAKKKRGPPNDDGLIAKDEDDSSVKAAGKTYVCEDDVGPTTQDSPTALAENVMGDDEVESDDDESIVA